MCVCVCVCVSVCLCLLLDDTILLALASIIALLAMTKSPHTGLSDMLYSMQFELHTRTPAEHCSPNIYELWIYNPLAELAIKAAQAD